MNLRLAINTEGLVAKQNRLLRFMQRDFLRVFKRFRVYMLQQTGLTFRALKQGGHYRGVEWRWYKDQYTRKTDGVTVPAEGGSPRVARGWKHIASDLKTRKAVMARHKTVTGNVKGKKRPSGKRVTKSSSLLRDTGRLAAATGMTLSFKRQGKTMILGTNVAYAEAQQARRPFLFFQVPQDEEVLQRFFVEEFEKAMQDPGGAPGGKTS